MKYRESVDGIFLDRLNRFIAHVDVNGVVETVHVKNTGRCKELLMPGAAVRQNSHRKPLKSIADKQNALRDPVTENPTKKCYHIVTENTNNIPMEDLNMKAKFYICEHCGNLVTTIHNAGVPLVCCGEKMKELLPNTVEASGEKHLPVAELSGSTLTVMVGAVEHPMVDVHHIQWLFVETENGGQLRYLAPGQAPKAVFELGTEKPVAVYAYCNLHGLWMTKL